MKQKQTPARTQAKKRSQERDQRLEAIFAASPDYIYMTDTNGKILDANPALLKRAGLSLEQMQQKNFLDFFAGDNRDQLLQAVAKLYGGHEIHGLEVRARNAQGEVFAYEVNAVPLKTRGKVTAILSLARDITERKQAEEGLRRYAERLKVQHKIGEAILAARSPEAVAQVALRYIQQLIPYLWGIVVTFEAKSADATVLAVLSNGETQMGVGKHLPLEAFGKIAGLRQGKVHRVKDLLALSRPTPLDQALRAEGVRSYMSVPLIFQGTLIGALCIGADSPGLFVPEHIDIAREMAGSVAIAIQQNRLYEQVQRHAEELEQRVTERTVELQGSEKLAATGRMAARIAHEINNPLAGIKNSFRLIRGAIPQDHPHYGYVNRINTEIDRIANIVRQMFDLYRPEQEQSRRFQIDEAIQDVVALLEPSCQQHEVRITKELPQPPAVVRLPEDVFRQVLFNLLVNAIEASPQKGEVQVKVGLTEREITLTVADQGQGIPHEVKSQIFEPFFTTKDGVLRRGLGLGLSISKNLVEGVHGRLDYSSREGQGAIFQVVLPQIEQGEERGR